MKIGIVFKRVRKGILIFLGRIFKTIREIPGLMGEKPMLTALIFLIIIGFVVLRITISAKQEGKEFRGNIIAEGYGVVFDIFVFGILIAFFNLLGEKRRDIKRWKEEIDDFRYWESDEAKFRIVGNIKRLNKAGVSNIKLKNCYLKGAILLDTNLEGADLRGANLEGAILGAELYWYEPLVGANLKGANLKGASLRGAKLWGANLEEANIGSADLTGEDLGLAHLAGADLWRVNLEGASLRGANLERTNLEEAYFKRANLVSANLMGADLWRVNLEGASLRGANLERANLEEANFWMANLERVMLNEADLREAIYISLDQLSKAKTLYRAKLDPELEAQVKEKYPHLLEEPKKDK